MTAHTNIRSFFYILQEEVAGNDIEVLFTNILGCTRRSLFGDIRGVNYSVYLRHIFSTYSVSVRNIFYSKP